MHRFAAVSLIQFDINIGVATIILWGLKNIGDVQMEKEFMSWEQFDNACRELAHKIKQSNLIINVIYGIPRGGLVVAVRLSHLLDIPMFLGGTTKEYPYYKFLIVDDIAETGKTLSYFLRDYPLATIYYNRKSGVVPDFWVHEKKSGSVVFPWEIP